MGTFKKLSLGLIVLLSSWVGLQAADTVDQVIGPFGTLNNFDNSYVIGADKAQDLLNVDVTPGGKSVKKRKGYGSAFALAITTSPVHGVYNFFDSSGNDISLFFNDRYMSASVSGAVVSVISSTMTNGVTYQCVDSQGFAYCVDTNRDTIIRTNGVTFSNITPTSNGKIIAVTPDRLVLSGFSANPSRIDFSKASDFTTWTIGGNPTDPNQITVSAPGSKITHLTYCFDRLVWFKDNSMGFILFGPTLGDWVVRTVSPTIGTLDNSSVFWEGNLYFRGQDGHIYVYNGATVSLLSRDIGNTISVAGSRTSNSWTQTTAADFAAGSLTNLDTTTVSGSLSLSLSTEGVKQSNDTHPNDTTTFGCSAPYYWSQSFTAPSTFLLTSVVLNLLVVGTPGTYTIAVKSDNSTTPGTTLGSTVLSSTSSIPADTGITTVTFSAGIPVNSGVRYWIQFSPNGTCDGTNHIGWWNDNFSQTEYRANNSTISQTKRLNHKLLGKTYSTSGTYLSAVKNASQLSTWDSFLATYQNNDGTNVFSIRSSTLSFTVAQSTPSWTTITPGNVPTISTGTYFQVRDVFTTTYSTETPVLNDFTQNWFEGSASDKAYATYFKNGIWWSIAYGTGTTSNNRVLIYDLLNRGWTVYDLASNGFLVRNNSLYFGSSSTGNIYKFGDTDDDNGSAINAYWKSKDFFVDNPFTDKELGYISVIGTSVQNSSMTVTYSLNNSSTTSYTVGLYKAGSSFVRSNKMIPTGKIGQALNIQFGNNAASQPFEVYGVQFGVRPKPWNTTP